MLSRTLKIAALAIVAGGTLAASAEAAVTDTDPVRLTSTGYDFGGATWAAGVPTHSGEVHFHHEGGQIRPHLLGTLHLNDADGTCARMRLEYFDAAGGWLRTNYGGSVCVDDDRHHSASVDLDPYADNSIHSVRVSVQKETVSGWWTTASLTTYSTLHRDDVKITRDGVDFGDAHFYLGQPESGSISWDIDDGVISPYLVGAMHLNNSFGQCVRMNLVYLTESGLELTSRAGTSECAPDDNHHSWPVGMSPYDSNRIGEVRVELQTLAGNNTWITSGSQTVSIAE